MTNEEKFTAIIERLKMNGQEFDSAHISTMVIIGYMNELAELGLIETAFTMTSAGKNVNSVCQEFDWKPSDQEIKDFVMAMVDEQDRHGFIFILQKYRDNKQRFMDEYNKFKQSDSEKS